MKEIKIRFCLKSSFSTPFLADTIFGHICWALKYINGNDYLEAFLKEYDKTLPLLVSDAFLCEGNTFYIPMPTLPLSKEVRDNIRVYYDKLDVKDKSNKDFATRFKKITKTKYIDIEFIKDSLKYEDILKKLFNNSEISRISTNTVTHNIIDRIKNTSNNVFMSEEYNLSNNVDMYFYIKYNEEKISKETITKALKYIEFSGFGKDANIGKGQIKIDYNYIEVQQNTYNYFINLSSAYVPNEGEIDGDCYYNFHVKRGKLGGDYVTSYSPWKKPILMLSAGALIKGESTNNYGRLIKNVHYELDNIVQYGYAYPLGVNYE